jgi:hypothetical protein
MRPSCGRSRAAATLREQARPRGSVAHQSDGQRISSRRSLQHGQCFQYLAMRAQVATAFNCVAMRSTSVTVTHNTACAHSGRGNKRMRVRAHAPRHSNTARANFLSFRFPSSFAFQCCPIPQQPSLLRVTHDITRCPCASPKRDLHTNAILGNRPRISNALG